MFGVYSFCVYFVQAALSLTGIAQTLYLKEAVGLSIVEITALGGIIIFPWTIKPLFGFLSDLLPIKGMRRKPYAILGSAMTIAGWWYMALGAATYSSILFGLILGSVGLAITDVICDGVVLDNSTKKNAGKLQSLCWSGNAVGAIVGSALSGYILAFYGYREVFALAAFLPMLTVLFAVRLEDKVAAIRASKEEAKEVFITYFRALKAWHIWVLIAFLYLWNISPSFGTPFFFHMKDNLGFSEGFLGIAGMVSSAGNLSGAALYGFYLDKFPLKKVLFWTIVFGSLIGISTFYILDEVTALIIFFLQGVAFTIGFVPVLKLAARSCPAHIEASLFALFASVLNLGKAHSSFLGAWMIEPLGLNALIWVSIVTSLLAAFFVPFLKEEIEEKKLEEVAEAAI